MNEAILKSLIDSLQVQRDALNFWLNLFSAMVAAGVIAEIIFLIREYLESLRDWQNGLIHPPHRPSRLWFWIELLGVVLVSCGVAGEFLVDVKSGSLETRIRKANESLILFLDEKVGDASSNATKAQIAAAKADTDAGEAQQKASGALTLAFGARTEANSASSLATKAQGKASSALSTLAWRTVTAEQKDVLQKALTLPPNFVAPLTGWKIEINVADACLECAEYASKLADILAGLGGKVVPGSTILGVSAQGLLVRVNPGVSRSPIPLRLLNELNAIGASAVGEEDRNLPSDTISITVFPKPHVEP